MIINCVRLKVYVFLWRIVCCGFFCLLFFKKVLIFWKLLYFGIILLRVWVGLRGFLFFVNIYLIWFCGIVIRGMIWILYISGVLKWILFFKIFGWKFVLFFKVIICLFSEFLKDYYFLIIFILLLGIILRFMSLSKI